jgi:hypothetical protein
MPVLPIDFDTVPDRLPPIEPGIYVLNVEGEPSLEENKDKTGINFVVKYKIADDGSMHNRMLTDFININTDLGQVRLRSLAKAAGVLQKNIGTTDFVGRSVRAEVVQNAGKGANTGNIYANIREYHVPA